MGLQKPSRAEVCLLSGSRNKNQLVSSVSRNARRLASVRCRTALADKSLAEPLGSGANGAKADVGVRDLGCRMALGLASLPHSI